ncbi:zinc knuckle [Ancylostoma caninum]|uniref:Zinc knuckle n=1 Tax=Ancylostoma caninum TaxID=29170 RepID=A0A368GKC9_ANCCA|nr:zinc knuckle [Ancylostoma caninum]
MVESQLRMEQIIAELDANITTEEHVNYMVTKSATVTTRTDNVYFSVRQGIRKPTPCQSPMHKSVLCTRYSTLDERRNFLNNNNMCFNCGREGHFVKDCTREGCRRWQGRKHNHVLCPHRMELGKHRNVPQNTSTMKTSTAPTMQKSAHAQQETHGGRARTTGRITQAHPIQIYAKNTETQDQEKSTWGRRPHSTSKHFNFSSTPG